MERTKKLSKNMKTNLYILVFLFLSGCVSLPQTKFDSTSSKECFHSETSFNCVKVVEVYDGDSIFIDLPDQHPLFGKRMGVRILGIDTPELRTKDSCEKKKGAEAKDFLTKILASAKRIDIVDIQKDKYFRILGTVKADGLSVADELIKQRLAYPYFGEKKVKRNWCK